MAPTKLIERTEPNVVPRAHTTRSRLPWPLRVFILTALNFGLKIVMWGAVQNFLVEELGEHSKKPIDGDMWSFYSPPARLALNGAIVCMNWYFQYDFYDVASLTVLMNAPFAYLLSTYYNVSTLTVAAYMNIEVLAIAIPTYLLRARSAAHKPHVPLRNRFLLNSAQVQASNAALAVGVYIVVLWAGLKTNQLTYFLIRYFEIPTLELAHAETPLSILAKVLIAGVAAKEFLLNPSIAAQPASTPAEEQFDPATATLDQTLKANVLPAEERKKTLLMQTIILNAFVFAGTIQRCMTLRGTEWVGAIGYSGIWVVANSLLSLWFAWVGDTSSDYEPL